MDEYLIRALSCGVTQWKDSCDTHDGKHREKEWRGRGEWYCLDLVLEKLSLSSILFHKVTLFWYSKPCNRKGVLFFRSDMWKTDFFLHISSSNIRKTYNRIGMSLSRFNTWKTCPLLHFSPLNYSSLYTKTCNRRGMLYIA